MDEHNNKKDYDQFFNPQDKNKQEEPSRSDNHIDDSEANITEANSESKTPYYYSYGPMSQQSSQQISQVPIDHDRSTNLQADSHEEPKVRAFTPSKGSAKSGWKVREKRRTSFQAIFLSFLAGMLVIGGLMYSSDLNNWFTQNDASVTQKNASVTGTTVSATDGNSNATNSLVSSRPNDLAQLFEKASPAVIKIETYVNARSAQGSSLLDDPFFRQFFGNNFSEPSQEQEQQNDAEMQQAGIGSGFFFDESGYILTNQHVIADSDEIRVIVQGYDEPITAELLGSSYELDLAVLKIESDKPFPTLPMGSSDDINIGDWVVAIGNPYGFDHTITAGVLSAKERPIDIQDTNGARNYEHLLQTDASINPGNSGGPLLNVNGEVIGINTAVSSQAQGIGFAIPTSTIYEVLENLKSNVAIPKPAAPFIGAELYEMTDEFAQQLGLEKAEGSLVKSVYYNSPAYLADLKQFDVILGIDGEKMDRTALIAAIQEQNVGDKVTFNIIRRGQEISLEVEIGDMNVFSTQ